MRAELDDGSEAAGPVEDEVGTTVLGGGPSPLAVLEGAASPLEMDRNEVGTPLGDLEVFSPR
ncbi:MAG: hypothetical protein M3P31_01990 [Actinomycetota bacterium]|nr:hypothetical protein [Actinomycetota bacterium]